MSPYFSRLLQPVTAASAKLSPDVVISLAEPSEHANPSDATLAEIDLVVEFEHPANSLSNSGARLSRVAGVYPTTSRASDERNASSHVAEPTGLTPNQVTTPASAVPETAPPSMTLPKPSETNQAGVERLPQPAEFAQTSPKPGNAAELEVMQKASSAVAKTCSASRSLPLIDEVLNWIAAEPQSIINTTLADEKSMSSALNMRPVLRSVDPEDLSAKIPNWHPVDPVQANRRPPLSPDSHPSGNQPRGAVKAAGGELHIDEVVRIAIGEIRVRVESPLESQHVMPYEAAPATPVRDGAATDAASSSSIGGSLRRRCIHL